MAKETPHYIDLVSLMVLMVNLHLASQDRDIGQGHAERSLRDLTRELVRAQDKKNCPPIRVKIKEDVLEACLWSCNMLNEKNKFWTPYQRAKSLVFGDLLKNVLYPNQHFDKYYNLIKTRKTKEV